MDKHDIINSITNLSIEDLDLQSESVLDYCELTEKDFYPPEDTRLYCSGVEDIYGGDNFSDYAKFFYRNYGNEIFDN